MISLGIFKLPHHIYGNCYAEDFFCKFLENRGLIILCWKQEWLLPPYSKQRTYRFLKRTSQSWGCVRASSCDFCVPPPSQNPAKMSCHSTWKQPMADMYQGNRGQSTCWANRLEWRSKRLPCWVLRGVRLAIWPSLHSGRIHCHVEAAGRRIIPTKVLKPWGHTAVLALHAGLGFRSIASANFSDWETM